MDTSNNLLTWNVGTRITKIFYSSTEKTIFILRMNVTQHPVMAVREPGSVKENSSFSRDICLFTVLDNNSRLGIIVRQISGCKRFQQLN